MVAVQNLSFPKCHAASYPSDPDSIYKKLPEKSTTMSTLCEKVPCLFWYTIQRSLGTCKHSGGHNQKLYRSSTVVKFLVFPRCRHTQLHLPRSQNFISLFVRCPTLQVQLMCSLTIFYNKVRLINNHANHKIQHSKLH